MEKGIVRNYLIQFPQTALKASYRVGLVVPTYNRTTYIRRCFRSLQASQLQDTVVIVVDDASDERESVNLVQNFSHKDAPVIRIFRVDDGCPSSIDDTFPFNLTVSFSCLLCFFSCRYLCILDSDTKVKPDWLDRLCRLHQSFTEEMAAPVIVSGFNTLVHPHVRAPSKKFIYKDTMGGINMLFTPDLYRKIISPIVPRWDEVVGVRMKRRDYKMICTRPSVVQHIGYQGSFSHGYLASDTAFDYNSSVEAWIRKIVYYTARLVKRGIKRISRGLLRKMNTNARKS